MKTIVGFCPSCKAIRYRTEWMGPVKCRHKEGCLEARRRKRQKELEEQ